MKAYKATNSKMQCQNQQFELGVWYEIPKEQKLELCKKGFHFCTELFHVQKYYSVANSRFFEIEVADSAETIFTSDKHCARRIKFVRELTFYECMRGFNRNADDKPFREENNNLGFGNRGNDNKGNDNVGNDNVGNCNVGSYNKGNDNVGSYNKGNCNNGNCNKGNDNVGNDNRGNDNRGNYNRGNYNVGSHNTGSYNQEQQ